MANLKGLASFVSELRVERTNLVDRLRHVDAALSVLLRHTIPVSLLGPSRSRHVNQESTACRNHTIVFFLIVGV